MADIKWSAFTNGAAMQAGDQLVGLRAGANVRFSGPISPEFGGTGVDNGSSTITLGGSLTTSGAFDSTFTMTGATNVTFPTSGTLLTSAGAVTSITGTANQVIASASTGAVTLSLPQDIATTSTVTFGQVNVDNLRLDGNTLSSTNANGNLIITLDGNGMTLIGSSSTFSGSSGAGNLQVARASTPCQLSICSFSASTTGAFLAGIKSRGNSVGNQTTLLDGDVIFDINSTGVDLIGFRTCARIRTAVSGSPGVSGVPSAMTFWTMNTIGTLATALTLSNTQAATFANDVSATLGIYASGSASGGVAGSFRAFATSASAGSITLTAANNAGNHANVLTHASTGAARTWTLPDATGTIALTSGVVSSITGTANQIIASASTGAVTLSTPQDIATTSSPTFVTETLSGLTASQAVVTDASKVLSSLAYTTTATASALVQRDSNANSASNRFVPNSNVESLSGTKTLVAGDAQYQFLNPNGADRTVQLPTGVANMLYIVKNTGTGGFNLTVQNASAVQVGNAISNGLVTGFFFAGSAWSTV